MKKIDLRADLNLLVVFQRLLGERHVGRAAKRLHVTQSAASHVLGRLRTMFHGPLFVRHPKGIQPTSRALALAPAIADILERANTLLASPGGFDPNQPHTFTIGGTDLALFTVLNPLIKRLRATAPKVDLRVRSLDCTRVVEAFDRQVIDCALVPFVEAPARITRSPSSKKLSYELHAATIPPSDASEYRSQVGQRCRTSWFRRAGKTPARRTSTWPS
jgi:DNA-binding transcriptional LysR family regulator